MTRGKQIFEAASNRYDGLLADIDSFSAGAEWADNNPSDETIKRIVKLYKEWYTTESSMSIVEYVKQHWEDK